MFWFLVFIWEHLSGGQKGLGVAGGLMCDKEPSLTDLSPRRTRWVQVLQRCSNYPSSRELWRSLYVGPPVLANPPVRLWLPVYVSEALQWIELAAVGHHLGLGYSFCSTLLPLLHIYIFFLTFLNDYAPARTYLIPRVLPEEAKKFSLYISGWCLQKSSDGIWQVVLPTLSLSQFHSDESSTVFMLQLCQLKTVQVRSHTRTSALFRIAPNDKKKVLGKVQELSCFCARERAATARRLSQYLRPDWTLNVSPMSALMQTRFQARRPSQATLLPSQQLRITGHSILIVGCHCRPNRLMNTVLQYC